MGWVGVRVFRIGLGGGDFLAYVLKFLFLGFILVRRSWFFDLLRG